MIAKLRSSSSSLLFLAVLAAAAFACRGGQKSANEEKPPTDPPAQPSSDPGFLGSFLANAARGDKSGPYDEPSSSANFDEDEAHAAIVEISGRLDEVASFSFTGDGALELLALIDRLTALSDDPAVLAIVLRFSDVSVDPALAEELRAELKSLGAKKPIACHAESVSTYTYWIMTGCTTVALTPGGDLAIPGIAAVSMHAKGLFDKLGLRADFIHIGDYKGAAEPLTLDAPSPQSRETTKMILDQAYADLVAAIAEGRGLEADAVRALIDQAMLTAEAALAAKLIDEISPWSAFRDRASPAWKVVSIDAEGGDPTAKLFELIGLRPPSRASGDRVALVNAVGNVVDGAGSAGGARTEIASRRLVAALDALRVDDEVKAVVLRISSPGGSALASEVIWGAIKELRETKPVIVSMGAVAASGGYYIAAPATRIFADRNTLTGSIGVVGGKVAISGGLAKLGVKMYPEGRGKNALLFASPEPWTPAQRDVVRSAMQAVYDQFAGRVREGRGDIADAHMQGRVWTGAKALELGLVDEIGGLRGAIDYAAEAVSLTDYELEIYPPEPSLRDMIGSLGVSSGLFAEAAADLDPRAARALTALVSLVSELRREPILAAALLLLYFD